MSKAQICDSSDHNIEHCRKFREATIDWFIMRLCVAYFIPQRFQEDGLCSNYCEAYQHYGWVNNIVDPRMSAYLESSFICIQWNPFSLDLRTIFQSFSYCSSRTCRVIVKYPAISHFPWPEWTLRISKFRKYDIPRKVIASFAINKSRENLTIEVMNNRQHKWDGSISWDNVLNILCLSL